jgi:3-oxoacyl-[acyl-carrier-protein] synthase II
MKRVVVTGVGLVTPLGVGVKTVWPRLLAGACGIQRLEALKGLPSEVAAPVPRQAGEEGAFDASSCRLLERGDEKSIAPFAQYALAAAADALDDAGWAPQTDA